MDYILEVANLSKRHKNSDFSLNQISFGVPYGSIMGFVGENGAGKTSTIGCILNTLLKDSGTVKIFGEEMSDSHTKLREEIGVVYDAGNFPHNLVGRQLSKVMQGIYSNWEPERFSGYMEQFHIPTDKKIGTFSRGMIMKLSLAVALSHGARLLILDEATSGLDPIVRDEISELLLDFVQDENHSIFLSTHITGDLEKIADYITFLHKGSIILTEKKDDLIYYYGVLRCRQAQFEKLEQEDILAYRKRDYQVDVLVKDRRKMEEKYRDVVMDPVSIDEIMLLLVRGEKA